MVPPEFVLAQMRTIAKDLNVGAIKTGMLGTLGIVRAVVEGLKAFPGVPVVVDPVMVAQSGDPLLDNDAIDAVRTELMPLAVVVTPNMPEAATAAGWCHSPGRGGDDRTGDALAQRWARTPCC